MLAMVERASLTFPICPTGTEKLTTSRTLAKLHWFKLEVSHNQNPDKCSIKIKRQSQSEVSAGLLRSAIWFWVSVVQWHPLFLFVVAASLRIVFPKRGSLFSRVTEQLRGRAFLIPGDDSSGRYQRVLHLHQNILNFPLLVLKGIHHYRKYWYFFPVP